MATSLQIPEVKEILKTGLQFGHNSSRWNPKMRDYIFTEKNGIHIIDVVQTHHQLNKAANFLKSVAVDGNVLFVATKRQAADIVEDLAVECGAHFVVNRWPGGLFTNYSMVKQSLAKLNGLEKSFEQGVEDRTKYEVTQMKKDWGRLNRLYRGVKTMNKLPRAIVVVDPNYERVAIREAKLMDIPVVALTDTNCNPDVVDYLVPGNDDALKSISMIMEVLATAVKVGNGGKGIEHSLTDYSEYDVELIKSEISGEDEVEEVVAGDEGAEDEKKQKRVKVSAKKLKKKASGQKGILEK